MSSPPVRFVTAPDGVQLAYAVYGDGPPLVWAAHWLTHLEFAWESPVWKHMVEFFSRRFTVIRYDERGCGLSDWTDQGLDFDTWVGDLGVIADAALGVEKFDLLGMSQGGPIAVEYAIRHPERVRRLILSGSFSSGDFIPASQREALGQLMEIGWGQSNPAFRQIFTSLFIPDATDEQRNWFNDLQQKSTSPSLAGKLYRAIQQLDVRDRLPLVRHPTLVLHSRGDAAIPFSAGRDLAAGIPDARLVPLPGDNHLLLEGTPGWTMFCREVEAFTGVADRASTGRASTDRASTDRASTDRASTDRTPMDRRSGPSDAETGNDRAQEGSYRFGGCVLDGRSRELWREGQVVPIERRTFDLLLYLVEHRGRAISKDELQEAVWPRMILTESALTRCVMKARRAVGDDPQRQSVIKTIHGHGYRFVAPLAPNA
jgi:pimeloyl-ACP methyl ester carboxylesterase/DNA-binding winged helix-turn-helix (wHTH) protein